MKTAQNEKLRIIVLTLSATVILLGLVSLNACRVSQFGFNKFTSISVTPANQIMAGGTQLQFQAAGIYSDATTTEDLTALVNWTASDPAVSVSSSGLVTAAQVTGPVTCIITATGPGGVSGSASLTIRNAQLNAIDVSPASADIDGGNITSLVATGTFTSNGGTFLQNITSMATWSTSDAAVATVDAGAVTGIDGGIAVITASWGGMQSNAAQINVSGRSLVSLDINPKDFAVPRMTGVFFTAVGTFNDGSVKDLTRAATWSTSDITIARIGSYSVNGQGMTVITQHTPGTATITAKLGNLTVSTSLIVSLTAPY